MKKIGEYWMDKAGNSWSCSYYTEKQALELSKALVNCTDCTDCKGCVDCTDCINCTDCTDCTGCVDCTDCTDC